MVTLKVIAIAAVVALSAVGIPLAHTEVSNPDTASLLLLGVGMIGTAALLRSQSPTGNN